MTRYYQFVPYSIWSNYTNILNFNSFVQQINKRQETFDHRIMNVRNQFTGVAVNYRLPNDAVADKVCLLSIIGIQWYTLNRSFVLLPKLLPTSQQFVA